MQGRIVLVNPNRMRPAVAPLGLDYLARALEAQGWAVDLLDLCFVEDTQAALKGCFAESSPEAVGLTIRNTDDCYWLSQDFFLPRYRELVSQITAYTRAPVILGGVGFSIMPREILSFTGADFGIAGEGEHALPELLRRLKAGEDYTDTPGLVYRVEGRIRHNPPRYLDLDGLDITERRAVDNQRYFREGGQGGIETKRGCDRSCIYCADPVAKGRCLRLRPPQAVADEVVALLAQGVDHLHLCDSEFNLPPEHAEAICEELVRRGLGERMRWCTYASPMPFSPELATLMQRAGCVGVNFGVDSGEARMLKLLGRDFGPEDLRRTAKICHEAGLVFMYDLLLGGPGESRESLQETIELMKRLNPDRIGAAMGVRVYPGTRLARMVRKEGTLATNPNLQGQVEGNEGFLAPVFYVSQKMGPEPQEFLPQLIGRDERFFLGAKAEVGQSYNYNDNSVLVKAIRDGYRGAYWDILRKLAEGTSPAAKPSAPQLD